MKKISRAVATLLFVGYFPFAPGTVASGAAVLVYLGCGKSTALYFTITVISLLLGFWSSSRAECSFSRKDPPQIVIDEFSGMLLAYLFIPFDIKLIVAGFVLFRIFDVFKIPPIKRLESLPKGYGIMLDDIAAAILTNIILQAIAFTT